MGNWVSRRTIIVASADCLFCPRRAVLGRGGRFVFRARRAAAAAAGVISATSTPIAITNATRATRRRACACRRERCSCDRRLGQRRLGDLGEVLEQYGGSRRNARRLGLLGVVPQSSREV